MCININDRDTTHVARGSFRVVTPGTVHGDAIVPEDNVIPHRGDLLDDLALFTLSDNEKTMREVGVKFGRLLDVIMMQKIYHHTQNHTSDGEE